MGAPFTHSATFTLAVPPYMESELHLLRTITYTRGSQPSFPLGSLANTF